MMKWIRGPGLAALGMLALSAPAGAQQTQQGNSVGPPALRDFELQPGNETAPARQSGPIIAPLPSPTAPEQQQRPPASEPVVTITPPPVPAPTRETTPARRQAAETPTREPTATPLPDESPSAQIAEPTGPVSTDTQAEPVSAPVETPPLDPPALEPADSPASWWPYLLLAALAAGLGFMLLRRKGRPAPALAAPASARAPVPEPEALPLAEPRPWIEIEFQASEAGANDSQAAVKFELMLRNVGETEARDVRVEARLFNAGSQQDREIGAFFGRPGPNAVAAPVPIAPQTQIPYRSVVLMPREQVREVNVQGRRLFIPLVAFNVRYRWGEAGSGQTSASYLVGTESDPPAEKMGAFRLDLGPRIYRKVGQREHALSRRI